MPVKMTGAEFKHFMNADWGPDAMWEDYVLRVNGEVIMPDDERADEDIPEATDIVTIEGGYIILDQNDPKSEPIDAEKFARKWLKAQTTASFVIEADKDQVEAIKALLRERFGKAVKIAA